VWPGLSHSKLYLSGFDRKDKVFPFSKNYGNVPFGCCVCVVWVALWFGFGRFTHADHKIGLFRWTSSILTSFPLPEID
jgi:hypothetical protein